ncbi:TMEM175 family protein [Pedobacter montanisoli]|uniref:TMEM175 family protein n=1 Tax=Pedobacter montanisoli TaxID=2923277 RepID=A0ABS9ZXE1_9SPHI|nr:TMEM175 family protein [Pedobacter montanisoli]MCJ0742982.1 TMEM175 family protein [Pedobacter montanisoli]
MQTNRLEAFSDGVLAIIITIMVLELKVPEGYSFRTLAPLFPKILSYVLSFLYVGIYWNNHHHLFHIIEKVNGKILWANLNLLFWLSLLPFATAWMGENHFEKNPVAVYGIILVMAAIAFLILEKYAIAHEGKDSKLSVAIRSGFKEKGSVVLYIAGIAVSFFYPLLSLLFYYIVAMMWLIPDKRIEKTLK